MEINHNHNHTYDRDDDDHDHHQEDERSSSSGIGGSRWNPTKEQIEMLERMYSIEGVRTPSAEQIQQITARLKVYGHIEGKNVFYWFQNHKARQRQKQRHERLLANNINNNNNNNSCVNHFGRIICPPSNHHYIANHGISGVNLNARPPILGAPLPPHHHHANYHYPYLPNHPNVICSPYYHLPQPNFGYYNPPQHHYNTSSTTIGNQFHQEIKKRSPSSSSKPNTIKDLDHQNMPRGSQRIGVPQGSTLTGYHSAMMNNSKSSNIHHHDNDHHDNDHHDDVGDCMDMRTLDLFPVHPTGILEHKLGGNSSTNNSCATSSSSDANMNDHHENHQHHHQNPLFFDFFSNGHHA